MALLLLIVLVGLQLTTASRARRGLDFDAPPLASDNATAWQGVPLEDQIPPEYDEYFQLKEPLPVFSRYCSIAQFRGTFANSWGAPQYTSIDPSQCPPDYDAIVASLLIHGAGRQFDRLAHIYVDNVEIWRPSTLEPSPTGTFQLSYKDISRFAALLNSSATLGISLNNIQNEKYTAAFVTAVDISFAYGNATARAARLQPADLILPLSPGKGASPWYLPESNAVTNISLAPSTTRAVVDFFASGAGEEEFWYANLPSNVSSKNPHFGVAGYGTYREVQVWIDDTLAGFALVFPVVYTGGINPMLWRPVVATDAFDQQSYTVDVTPFLGVLTDGQQHAVAFRVATTEDSVGLFWLVSGSLHIWSGSSAASYVPGSLPIVLASTRSIEGAPKIAVTGRDDVEVRTTVRRQYTVSGIVNGENTTWSQRIWFDNIVHVAKDGDLQISQQRIHGETHLTTSDARSSGSSGNPLTLTAYSQTFDYKLSVNTTLADTGLRGNKSVTALLGTIDHTKFIQTIEAGASASPAAAAGGLLRNVTELATQAGDGVFYISTSALAAKYEYPPSQIGMNAPDGGNNNGTSGTGTGSGTSTPGTTTSPGGGGSGGGVSPGGTADRPSRDALTPSSGSFGSFGRSRQYLQDYSPAQRGELFGKASGSCTSALSRSVRVTALGDGSPAQRQNAIRRRERRRSVEGLRTRRKASGKRDIFILPEVIYLIPVDDAHAPPASATPQPGLQATSIGLGLAGASAIPGTPTPTPIPAPTAAPMDAGAGDSKLGFSVAPAGANVDFGDTGGGGGNKTSSTPTTTKLSQTTPSPTMNATRTAAEPARGETAALTSVDGVSTEGVSTEGLSTDAVSTASAQDRVVLATDYSRRVVVSHNKVVEDGPLSVPALQRGVEYWP